MMNGRVRLLLGSAAAVGLLAMAGVGTIFAADPAPAPPGPAGVETCDDGLHRGGAWGFSSVSQALQKLTGLTEEEIHAERDAGKSAVQIAAERGVAEDALLREMLDSRRAALEEAVGAGRITQDRVEQMLGNMAERVKEGLNRTETGSRGEGAGPWWTGKAQRGAGEQGQGMGPGPRQGTEMGQGLQRNQELGRGQQQGEGMGPGMANRWAGRGFSR